MFRNYFHNIIAVILTLSTYTHVAETHPISQVVGLFPNFLQLNSAHLYANNLPVKAVEGGVEARHRKPAAIYAPVVELDSHIKKLMQDIVLRSRALNAHTSTSLNEERLDQFLRNQLALPMSDSGSENSDNDEIYAEDLSEEFTPNQNQNETIPETENGTNQTALIIIAGNEKSNKNSNENFKAHRNNSSKSIQTKIFSNNKLYSQEFEVQNIGKRNMVKMSTIQL